MLARERERERERELDHPNAKQPHTRMRAARIICELSRPRNVR
jgi:hypothetical protein